MRTIALEEHFITPELSAFTAMAEGIAQPHIWREASRRLLDLTGERIELMDEAGVDLAILSLLSPGIQAESDASAAVAQARAANDFLAEFVHEHPDRFGGFAALPLQDPQAAADELERAVTELGLCGALVNAHSQGRYLDDPDLRGVWERAEGLDVPLYLHPGNGADVAHVLSGYPQLIGPLWSWGIDTATHTLRLIWGGVFDDFPQAKLLLGHMGEGLPYVLWRLDSRWEFHNHHGVELARGRPSSYLQKNIYVTTSGVASDVPLLCALLALGADHILFASDYPFESMADATGFLARAPISETDRAKISHGNAESLLKLPQRAAPRS
jgi:2,3-dihydroxybenzoate decarboxylase